MDKAVSVSDAASSSLPDAASTASTAVVSRPPAGDSRRPSSTTMPPILVVPLSPPPPRRTTPPTVASPNLAVASAPSVTAEVRRPPEPLISVELVAGVVGGGAVFVVMLAVAVAAVCRWRSREHGTYNVDAATVNGYAYEICTTSSSVGSSSTSWWRSTRRRRQSGPRRRRGGDLHDVVVSRVLVDVVVEICTTSSSVGSSSTATIGGTRRKARAVAGGAAVTFPAGSGGGGGRKAGKTKKVVREWYV